MSRSRRYPASGFDTYRGRFEEFERNSIERAFRAHERAEDEAQADRDRLEERWLSCRPDEDDAA